MSTTAPPDAVVTAVRHNDVAARFAQAFLSARGHAPRVLHIGNIANNAYNNAKVLNRSGFDCDVICYDYYHVMGCPEWEDADYVGSIGDASAPDWTAVDLRGFKRPQWFAQGPLPLCIDYLTARRDRDTTTAEMLWLELARASKYPVEPRAAAVREHLRRTLGDAANLVRSGTARLRSLRRWARARTTGRLGGRLADLRHAIAYLARRDRGVYRASHPHLRRVAAGLGRLQPFAVVALVPVTYAGVFLIRVCVRPFVLRGRRRDPLACEPVAECPTTYYGQALVERMRAEFVRAFPARADIVSRQDIEPYLSTAPLWRDLFQKYDFVCAYSTDPILPLLAEHRPYIAYEHGTIRDIPWERTATARLCALAYAQADVVYVTNADSIGHARALGARRLVYGLHGFDEERLLERIAAARAAGPDPRFRANGKAVFFAPARHQWRDGFASWLKGNDLVIRAAAQLKRELGTRFEVVFVDWGQEVALSRQLIDDLGVADHVRWIPPLPKVDLLRAYASVDCVIDQFVLPCIGSVTFEALAVGAAPVITRLDDAAMQEHYGRTIPLFNCATAEEICRAMSVVVSDPPRAGERARASNDWFHERHNAERLRECLIEALERCDAPKPEVLHAAV